MGGSFTQQFKGLLHRNLLLKRRRIASTCVEIIGPLFMAAFVAIPTSQIPRVSFPAIQEYDANSLFQSAFYPSSSKTLLVVPNDTNIKNIMDHVVSDLSITATPKYKMFSSTSAMEEAFRDNPNTYSNAVEFFGDQVTGNGSYVIRVSFDVQADVKTTIIYGAQPNCRTGIKSNNDGLGAINCPPNTGYLYSGFASLQAAIDNALIKVKTSNLNFQLPTISMKLMPKDAYTYPPKQIQLTIGIMTGLMFMSFYLPLVNLLVAEKEKKIRDTLNMTGLNRTAFWLAWSVIYLPLGIIVSLLVVGILRAGSLFIASNFGLVFIITYLYVIAGFFYAMMVSTFFNKGRVASVAFIFTFFLPGLLYLVCKIPVLQGSQSEMLPVAFWLLSLFPQVAFSLAMDQVIYMDIKLPDVGAQFYNTGFTDFQQNFAVSSAIVMLLVDIVLYVLLMGYCDNVIPGLFGKRKSATFFLKKSYWHPEEGEKKDFTHLLDGATKMEDVESVPNELIGNESIRIYNIKKSFNTGKTVKDEEASKGKCLPVRKKVMVNAVDGVSLDIYEGIITAILGHNGAGKSTLFGLMSGLISPSHGTTTIYGKDVCSDGDLYNIQHMLGVCPQHDILYDDLSVKEHLVLWANIRGVQDIDSEVDRVTTLVDLANQVHTYSSELSGGQKRKLSVGMAFIGDPKVIFLDEPTAGMDPYSRRKMWTLLKTIKHKRTILLTTHFMDEADILADRKAIINKGKLQCYGSSMFLKNRFGIGYRLNMVTTEGCSTEDVTTFVNSHVPEASIIRRHGMELSYNLPMNDTDKFGDLFKALEGEGGASEGLGIKNYGMSMPTLEEVFLRLAETNEIRELNEHKDDADIDLEKILLNNPIKNGNDHASLLSIQEEDKTNGQTHVNMKDQPTDVTKTGNYKSNQFNAMMWMRWRALLRVWWVMIFRLFLPIAFGVGGILILALQPNEYKFEIPAYNNFTKSWPAYFSSSSPLMYINSTGSSLAKLVSEFDSKEQITSTEMAAGSSITDNRPLYGAYNFTYVDMNNFNTSSTFTLLYNDSALHSIPLLLNTWSNALYKAYSGDQSWTIDVKSLALPKLNPSIGFSGRIFNSIRLIGLAFCMLSGQFGFEVTEDRELKIRSQLKFAGVSVRMYWLATSAFHGIQVGIGTLCCIVPLLAINVVEFSSTSAYIQIVLLVLLNVPANLLFCYVQTFAFKNPETVGSVQGWGVSLWGILPYLAISFLDPVNYTATVALHYIFCIVLPPYLIIGGLHFMVRIYNEALINGVVDQITEQDYWLFSNHVIGTIIIAVFHVIFLTVLLVVLDIRSTGGSVRDAICGPRPRGRIPPLNKVNEAFYDDEGIEGIGSEEEDSDIIAEREVVHDVSCGKLPSDDTVILVKGLRKVFSKRTGNLCNCCEPTVNKTKVAVDDLTFHVQAGEVFGLLGHNGAGKTTALNTITAEVGPDRGEVMVGGYSIESNLSKAFHELGCCPQHDQLWRGLTLEEHLRGYAKIHGIPDGEISQVIQFYLENLNIEEHRHKTVHKLSGGTKRKLSFAIAMIGMPKAVLLDEPSTGMDPASKRFLWDTVIKCFSGTERGCILTTHSMEEADALCTRVGIMVAGRLKCLGPTQHLKTKFGGGYTLEVKLHQTSEDNSADQLEALSDHIRGIFPDVIILEEFGDRVQYKVPSENVKALSVVFSSVEAAKEQLNIEEYSFSQSTLEQVFISFAKQEYEAVESVMTRKTSVLA